MKNKKRFSSESEDVVEIILTPFIDTLLVLLVVFIVATPAIHYFVNINLPGSMSNNEEQKEKSICIALDQYGNIITQEKKRINDEEFKAYIKHKVAQDPRATLVIFADSSSLSGKLIEIMDIARMLGVSYVYCKTKKISS